MSLSHYTSNKFVAGKMNVNKSMALALVGVCISVSSAHSTDGPVPCLGNNVCTGIIAGGCEQTLSLLILSPN